MRRDKATMNWQRQILAIYGFLLPILAPAFGFLAYDKNGHTFWYSISATFYASSNILMIGVLAIFGFFLWTYQGYDLGDKCTCRFSSCCAFGILVFPCQCAAADITTGILNLPTDISNIIHCAIASCLFFSFAYMIGFRFTKTDKKKDEISIDKKHRNIIYIVCAILIAIFMINQIITSILNILWMTIINEAIMLWAFSFAWAVKAGTFRRLKDKEERVLEEKKE